MQRTRKFVERYIRNREHIRRDIGLVLKHFATLPYIVLPYRSEAGVKSELDWRSYNSWPDVLSVIVQVVWPSERTPISEGTLTCQPDHHVHEHEGPREKWFFINGIATSPPTAIINARELARVYERPIHLIHTPTYSALWDFWDSMTARTLRKDGKLSRPAFKVVKRALETHDRVVIIGHSQGTIVSSYIARKLLKQPETRDLARKLEIYCIAGVADSHMIDPELSQQHGHAVPYVEHFSNGFDFFARIGVLSHLETTAGAVFNIPERRGHLLNDHYMPGLERGDYCGGRSRLRGYVHGNEPVAGQYCPPGMRYGAPLVAPEPVAAVGRPLY